jgi:hypothetical protein
MGPSALRIAGLDERNGFAKTGDSLKGRTKRDIVRRQEWVWLDQAMKPRIQKAFRAPFKESGSHRADSPLRSGNSQILGFLNARLLEFSQRLFPVFLIILVASVAHGGDRLFQPSVRSPRLGEIVYFLLPDRFNDGDPSNNRGGLASAAADESGFDPRNPNSAPRLRDGQRSNPNTVRSSPGRYAQGASRRCTDRRVTGRDARRSDA